MGEMVPAVSLPVQQNWVDLFQALFSAHSPTWGPTLLAWKQLFEAESRSNSELVAVCHGIAKRTTIPKFAPEFLQAIREELAKQDASFARQREDARLADLTQPTRCRKCRDVGMITGLPHVDFVDGVNWNRPRYTQSATCDCAQGQQSRQKWLSMEKPVMTFGEYERRNPHWRSQVQMRRLEVEAELTAHRQQHGDPAWAAVVERLKARMANG